jgi:hypothetical protein
MTYADAGFFAHRMNRTCSPTVWLTLLAGFVLCGAGCRKSAPEADASTHS